VLVWIHGGGWSIGDLDGYDAVARALANRAGRAVLSVDYRLVPEYRHPTAIEDCWAATE
jgi:acetyl esterase